MGAVSDLSKKLLVVVLAAAGILFGGFAFVREVQILGILDLGDEIFKGRVVTAQATERLLALPVDQSLGPSCRHDFVKARMLVAVGLRRAVLAKGLILRVRPELERLAETARLVLACNPADGYAWTQLAIARDQLGAPTEEIRRYFELSQWTAPSELWVIGDRLPAMAMAGSRRDNPFGELMRQDVRSLLMAEHDEFWASEFMGPIFIWIEAIAQEEFRKVTDLPRREQMVRLFGRWGANLSGCDTQKFNDWMYRGMHGTCEEDSKIPSFDWQKKTD